jgi:hypothetical protein
MGYYPIAIYYKLMSGLKEKIPNDGEIKKHITRFLLRTQLKNNYIWEC